MSISSNFLMIIDASVREATSKSFGIPPQCHRDQLPTTGIDGSTTTQFGPEMDPSISLPWTVAVEDRSPSDETAPQLGRKEMAQAHPSQAEEVLEPQSFDQDRSATNSSIFSHATTPSKEPLGHCSDGHPSPSDSSHTNAQGGDGNCDDQGDAFITGHGSPNESVNTLTDVSGCSQNDSHLPFGGRDATTVEDDLARAPSMSGDGDKDSLLGDIIVPGQTSELDSDLELSESNSTHSSPIPILDSLLSPCKEDLQPATQPSSPPVPNPPGTTLQLQNGIASHTSLRPTPNWSTMSIKPPPPPLAHGVTDPGPEQQESTTDPAITHTVSLSLATHPSLPPNTSVLTAKTSNIPGIKLPNFFIPPHELELSMRSLRATALLRPPPRLLNQTHQQERGEVGAARCSPVHGGTGRTFRTIQEINTYLESRRSQVSPDGATSKQPQRPRELSTAEAQRIAKIFSSKPAQTQK